MVNLVESLTPTESWYDFAAGEVLQLELPEVSITPSDDPCFLLQGFAVTDLVDDAIPVPFITVGDSTVDVFSDDKETYAGTTQTLTIAALVNNLADPQELE